MDTHGSVWGGGGEYSGVRCRSVGRCGEDMGGATIFGGRLDLGRG